MATTKVVALGARKRVFDVTVTPGTPQIIRPSSLSFNIVASSPGVAGTYSIEFACTEELEDWRALNNSATVPNTGLAGNGTVEARTSTVYSPGVQRLRLTSVTQPTRFIGYGT